MAIRRTKEGSSITAEDGTVAATIANSTGQITVGNTNGWKLPVNKGTNDKYVLQINTATSAANWVESLTAPELTSHNFDVSGSTDDGGINKYEEPYTATGNTTDGSNSIASISITSSGDDINDLKVGQFVSGAGIPANTVIKAISGTTITLKDNTSGSDTNATATNTGTALSIQKTPGEKNGGKVTLSGTNFGINIADISIAITDSGGGVIANASYLSGLSSGNTIVAEWTGTEGTYSTKLKPGHSDYIGDSGLIYFKMTKSGLASNVLNTNTSLTSDPTVTAISNSSQTGGDRDTTVNLSASSLGTYGSGRTAGGAQDSNTKLLLNFNRNGGTDIEDSSNIGGNGHKVTAAGHATIKASPFGDGKSAIFFDGSNDKLTAPDSADWDFGTGNWTIECWVNHDSSQTSGDAVGIVGKRQVPGSGGKGWEFKYVPSSKTIIYFDSDLGAERFNYVHNLDNKWTHLAVVKSGTGATDFKLFIDGKLVSSGQHNADIDNDGNTQVLTVGMECNAGGNNFWKGYMDEIRIVKGAAVYSGDFTVPTSRLTAITNTKLLIHSNKEDDASDSNHTLTRGGGVTENTAQTAYTGGIGSFVFDGSDDYITTGADTDFDFRNDTVLGTAGGDFTIECYVRRPVTTGTQVIFGRNDTDNDSEWYLRFEGSNLNFWNGSDHTAAHGMSADTWYHVALVRKEHAMKIYLGGQILGGSTSFTDTYDYDSGAEFEIGHRLSGGSRTQWLNGFVKDVRVTKGLAVYTGAFTKPSGPLTTTWTQTGSGTPTSNGGYTSLTNVATNSDASKVKLLLHGDGGKFTDSSDGASNQSTAHTITPTGSYHSQSHRGIAPALAFPASGMTHGSAGVYFDGDTSHGGDRITISPAPTHMTTQGLNTTVEFWFYCTGHGNRMSLFRTPVWDKSGIGCNLLFEINQLGHFKGWFLDAKGYNNTESGNHSIYYVENFQTTFKNNKWHHFAFTHTGWGGSGGTTVNTNGVANVFCDGKYLAPTGTDTRNLWKNKLIDATEDNLCFGGGPTGSDTDIGSFKGYMDGIRVSASIRYTGTSTSEWGNYDQPTRVYGAFGEETPDVGTITLTATGDGTFTWSEVAGGTALPGTMAVGSTTKSGSGNSATHTATITGAYSSTVSSDSSTQGILLKVQDNTDATRAITLNGADGMSITQKPSGKPTLYNARRFIGNATARDINGYGFQPDLVWMKYRTATAGTQSHMLYDSLRGQDSYIYSNLNNAAGSSASERVTFTSDGFSLASGQTNNVNGNEQIAWAWKAGGAPSSSALSLSGGIGAGTISQTSNSGGSALSAMTQSVNQNSGFSITKYTGGATTENITYKFPHNLGGIPEFIIIKNISGAYDWVVFHKDLSAATDHSITNGLKNLNLNNHGDEDNKTRGSIALADSTDITIVSGDSGSGSTYNARATCRNGDNYICYAWKKVAGVSAFGIFTSSQNGTRVYTTTSGNAPSGSDVGFRPKFIMAKTINYTSTYAGWTMIDGTRVDFGSNSSGNSIDKSSSLPLYANKDFAEGKRGGSGSENSEVAVDIFDDGFEFDNADNNPESNGWQNSPVGKHIWVAFA